MKFYSNSQAEKNKNIVKDYTIFIKNINVRRERNILTKMYAHIFSMIVNNGVNQ